MPSYPIAEIFYSIQGEGFNAGRAAVFVRMHGCNLNCSFGAGKFCDDLAHKAPYKVYMTPEEVLSLVKKFPAKFVVITGGEPTLHDCDPLILALQDAGYEVQVETNGYNLENVSRANWITYSPKKGGAVLKSGFNEIKILAGVDNPPDQNHLLEDFGGALRYIQPISYMDRLDMENVDFCRQLIEEFPGWRLSLQLHKILGVK